MVHCRIVDFQEHPANVERVHITKEADDAWGVAAVATTRRSRVLSNLGARFGRLPGGAYDDPSHTAIVLPLSRPGLEHPYGVLVSGVSLRRALDDRYRDFFELAADHIATAISNAVALDEARQRRSRDRVGRARYRDWHTGR